MQIAVVHGYFLADSGSGIYVRELVRELVLQGHDVTLVCQESDPERFDFIDEAYEVSAERTGFIRYKATHVRRRKGLRGAEGRPPGFCRLLRPDLKGRLLVYVPGRFDGYVAEAFQEASQDSIDEYVEANVRALQAIFEQWSHELVLANHAIMQPYIVRRALESDLGEAPGGPTGTEDQGGPRGQPTVPYLVTIHGSALNFSVKRDPRLVSYAREGLAGAKAIVALSPTSRGDVVSWASDVGLDIAAKTFEVPPGVDVDLFRPYARASALEWVAGVGVGGATPDPIDARSDDVIVFAGRLLRTKGVQYAVAAMPWVLARRPRAHLVLVGEGPMRESLERFIQVLDLGEIEEARRMAEEDPELAGDAEFGAVVPEMDSRGEVEYVGGARKRLAGRVRFTGHVDHERLARILATADISAMPSVFPEAFALASLEGLAAGALPVATYQTGLRAASDYVAQGLGDDAFKRLEPPTSLTRGMADRMVELLEGYPSKDDAFRARLHDLAVEEFSWERVARRCLELA